MPKPIPKPPRAEEVLAAVAARYPAGATVTLAMIAEAAASTRPRRARSAGGRGRWAAGLMRTVRGGPAESSQADRPAAADRVGLVVDSGSRGSRSR